MGLISWCTKLIPFFSFLLFSCFCLIKMECIIGEFYPFKSKHIIYVKIKREQKKKKAHKENWMATLVCLLRLFLANSRRESEDPYLEDKVLPLLMISFSFAHPTMNFYHPLNQKLKINKEVKFNIISSDIFLYLLGFKHIEKSNQWKLILIKKKIILNGLNVEPLR